MDFKTLTTTYGQVEVTLAQTSRRGFLRFIRFRRSRPWASSPICAAAFNGHERLPQSGSTQGTAVGLLAGAPAVHVDVAVVLLHLDKPVVAEREEAPTPHAGERLALVENSPAVSPGSLDDSLELGDVRAHRYLASLL